jgi:DNA-binding NtrC family response regulator
MGLSPGYGRVAAAAKNSPVYDPLRQFAAPGGVDSVLARADDRVMKQQPTVLVVDDEGDVVKSVQDLLRLDYRVLGATRASDGLQLMEWESVDVVMTDQRMPDMSGVELLRRIRELHPDAIRMLFTGHADMAAVVDAINQGSVYRYISKPWDPEELQATLKEAIRLRDLTAERDQLLVEMHAKNE